jgi:hypothetical protein
MTMYISQGRYTAAAIRAMTTRPEDRSEAIALRPIRHRPNLNLWHWCDREPFCFHDQGPQVIDCKLCKN